VLLTRNNSGLRFLDIPNNVSPFICIPLGYAADPPQGRYRRQLEDMVHWNKFDTSKMRSDDEMQPTALWKKM
jgi:hypothetical protein